MILEASGFAREKVGNTRVTEPYVLLMHQSCPLARHQIIQARDIFTPYKTSFRSALPWYTYKKKKRKEKPRLFSTLTFSTIACIKSVDWSNLNSRKAARRIERFNHYVTNDLNSKVDVTGRESQWHRRCKNKHLDTHARYQGHPLAIFSKRLSQRHDSSLV